VFVDNVFGVKFSDRVCFLDVELDNRNGYRDYGLMPFLSLTIGIGNKLRFFSVKDYDSEAQFFESVLGFMRRSMKSVIVGFNVNFDMENLKKRAENLCGAYGLSWLKLCYPFDMREEYKNAVKGLDRYSLDEVAKFEKIGKKVNFGKKVCDMTESELEEYNMGDVQLLMDLEKKKGLVKSRIALQETVGLPMSMNSAYVIGDTLVLRRMRELGYVAVNGEKKEVKKYEGAYVKEPIPGYYENIADLDAVSLYPSVIMKRKIDVDGFNGEVVPYLVEKFFNLKEDADKRGDEVARNVYKIMSNAMYGLFGYGKFRYYDRAKAEEVARGGREVLMKSIKFLEGLGVDVKYADTDSMFFSAVGVNDLEGLIDSVNREMYPYRFKLDHLFDQLIMFKKEGSGGAKKRYVGKENGKLFVRGIELRRSDWCGLAKRVLEECIRMKFERKSTVEIRKHLEEVKADLFRGKFDRELVITKGVKEGGEYLVKTPQGTAWKKAVENKLINEHETEVSYVFVRGGVEPYVDGESFDYDYKYYYEHQIYPPVRRLLESLVEEKQTTLM
jgi:DNA polymerase elongation subunit (family B)